MGGPIHHENTRYSLHSVIIAIFPMKNLKLIAILSLCLESPQLVCSVSPPVTSAPTCVPREEEKLDLLVFHLDRGN